LPNEPSSTTGTRPVCAGASGSPSQTAMTREGKRRKMALMSVWSFPTKRPSLR
jgi:hypothetical protein